MASINFEMGYDAGLAGGVYRCPSNGNKCAEADYTLGYFAGEKRVPRTDAAHSHALSLQDSNT